MEIHDLPVLFTAEAPYEVKVPKYVYLLKLNSSCNLSNTFVRYLLRAITLLNGGNGLVCSIGGTININDK